jgi:hypothetical protein
MPTAAATISRPPVVSDGRMSSRRTASWRVITPTSRPPSSSTGAALTRASSIRRNASRLLMPIGNAIVRGDISSAAGVY